MFQVSAQQKVSNEAFYETYVRNGSMIQKLSTDPRKNWINVVFKQQVGHIWSKRAVHSTTAYAPGKMPQGGSSFDKEGESCKNIEHNAQ